MIEEAQYFSFLAPPAKEAGEVFKKDNSKSAWSNSTFLKIKKSSSIVFGEPLRNLKGEFFEENTRLKEPRQLVCGLQTPSLGSSARGILVFLGLGALSASLLEI